MRQGARKLLCLLGGLQWPFQTVSRAGVWAPACPSGPSQVRCDSVTSPCCASASPLHPAANCTSQGGACNTFHHLYLLAGKMRHFIGPGTDIQTSKEILFVSGGGESPVWAWGSGCSAFLAGLAWIHQDVEGLSSTQAAKFWLDLTKTELKKLMGEMRGGLCGLKSPNPC